MIVHLPAPVRAQHGDRLPGLGHEGDVVEHVALAADVAEADVVELHPALDAPQVARRRAVLAPRSRASSTSKTRCALRAAPATSRATMKPS